MRTTKSWIDEATLLCDPPTKRELAKRIGTTPPNLSTAAACKHKLTADQIAALAAIVGQHPGILWRTQAIEYIDRKNPFMKGRATLAALIQAFMTSILLVLVCAPSPSHASEKSDKSAVDTPHIVDIARQITRVFVWLFRRWINFSEGKERRSTLHAEPIAQMDAVMV